MLCAKIRSVGESQIYEQTIRFYFRAAVDSVVEKYQVIWCDSQNILIMLLVLHPPLMHFLRSYSSQIATLLSRLLNSPVQGTRSLNSLNLGQAPVWLMWLEVCTEVVSEEAWWQAEIGDCFGFAMHSSKIKCGGYVRTVPKRTCNSLTSLMGTH